MYAQLDADGFSHTLLDHISDYKKDGNAIEKYDADVIMKRGRKRLRSTTG